MNEPALGLILADVQNHLQHLPVDFAMRPKAAMFEKLAYMRILPQHKRFERPDTGISRNLCEMLQQGRPDSPCLVLIHDNEGKFRHEIGRFLIDQDIAGDADDLPRIQLGKNGHEGYMTDEIHFGEVCQFGIRQVFLVDEESKMDRCPAQLAESFCQGRLVIRSYASDLQQTAIRKVKCASVVPRILRSDG